MSDAVANAPPPKAVLAILNPILKTLLRTPLAPKSFVVLHFRGRKTAKRYSIVVGVHEVDGERAVFSAAPWTANFRGGVPVEVTARGKDLYGTGTLVEDPEVVAPKFQQAIDAASPRALGIKLPPGHRLTPADVRMLDRRMIRLEVQ